MLEQIWDRGWSWFLGLARLVLVFEDLLNDGWLSAAGLLGLLYSVYRNGQERGERLRKKGAA